VKHFQTAGLLCAVTFALGTLQGDASEQVSIKPPFGSHGHKGGSGGNTTIKYHGGPVLKGPVPVYIIYYGTFPTTPTNTASIVTNFFTDLSNGPSPQFDVNTVYYDSGGNVTGPVAGPTIAYDAYSQGKSLGSSTIPKIIQTAIGNGPGKLAADASGVYFVVTAPDVKVSGFCTSFCAYHTRTTIASTDIKYALIPDPGQACTGCDGNAAVFHESKTPNGDMAGDEMIDSIFHELSEAVTDPDLNAWYTSNGSENADLCNYVYGSTLPAPNGSTANVRFGNHYYLIQTIWDRITASCANTLP
jgi:hypothetical protein